MFNNDDIYVKCIEDYELELWKMQGDERFINVNISFEIAELLILSDNRFLVIFSENLLQLIDLQYQILFNFPIYDSICSKIKTSLFTLFEFGIFRPKKKIKISAYDYSEKLDLNIPDRYILSMDFDGNFVTILWWGV